MKLIYENEVGSANLDEANSILVFKANKVIANQRIEQIRELLTMALQFAKSNKIVGEVVDLNVMRGNYRLVIEYLLKSYYPQMQTMGMTRVAYVVPDDLISKHLTEQICAGNVLPTSTFQSMEEAITWVSNN